MNAHPETAKNVAALLQTGTGKRLIDTIRRTMDRFVEIEETLAADRYALATRTAATARTTTLIVLISAIGLGIGLAVAASRAISGPLTRLVVGAEAVGTGDFATRVVVESSDGIGGLAQAFTGMVSRLEDAASQRDRLETQLRHAQKLESIGQLAAGIAHEINTPAQYVNDNTRFLEQSFAALIPILKKVDQLAASVPKRTASSELAGEVTAALEEADIDYLTEEIPRAIESFEGAVEVEPDNANGRFLLGYALQLTGQAAAAIPHLRVSIEIQPNFPSAHQSLGLALADTGPTAPPPRTPHRAARPPHTAPRPLRRPGHAPPSPAPGRSDRPAPGPRPRQPHPVAPPRFSSFW